MALALVSVSDKTNLKELADLFRSHKISILSTGGTARELEKLGAEVKKVEDYTEFPESPDGLVKSLHPKIHFGLLMDRKNKEHLAYAKEHKIEPIDFLVGNLYPFEKTAENPDATIEDLRKNIDIGGPSMIRSAAKNWEYVTVVTDPKNYDLFKAELDGNDGTTTQEFRYKMSVKAFYHTLKYDSSIQSTLSKRLLDSPTVHLSYTNGRQLRYGENWHQEAAFYKDAFTKEANIGHYKQHHGKALSFNNFVDGNAALECCKEFPRDKAAVVIVKHNVQCGVAISDTTSEAFEKAWEGDPISAFGSVIAFNRTFDLATAKLTKGKFIELIIAPKFEPEAVDYLINDLNKKLLRILEVGEFGETDRTIKEYKTVLGGILEQDRDLDLYADWEETTQRKFDKNKKELAKFAIICSKHIKSNASVIVRAYKPNCFQLLGLGSGQPNRVDTLAKLAVPKAHANLHREYEKLQPDQSFEEYATTVISECVYASEAFFPFRDTVDAAAEMGLQFIVQPGGSKRDQESIDAANEHNIAMIFTRMRHFKH